MLLKPRTSACLFHSELLGLALIEYRLLGSEANPYIYTFSVGGSAWPCVDGISFHSHYVH